MSRNPFLTSTALAGLLVAAPSAFAADQPPPVLKAPPAPPPFSWTGFYVGANAGYAWSQDPSISCTFAGFSPCAQGAFFPAPEPKGVLGGVQAGYNWQVGSWVIGLEGDINALAARDDNYFPSVDPAKTTDRLTSRYDWLGTVRGRAGYAAGQSLFYATGGLAVGGARHAYVFGIVDNNVPIQTPQSFSTHNTRIGWTAGGGAEFGVSRNVSFKVEYLYVHLQKSSLDVSSAFDDPTILNFNNNFSIVRAGINFRF